LPFPVEVEERPARTVAARASRGGYSRANVERTTLELAAWLAAQTDWRPVGEPYAVFWNGPFTPGPFKRYEVHQVVERVPPTPPPVDPAEKNPAGNT